MKRIDFHLCLSCVSGLLQLAKEALPYWRQIQTEKHYRPEMLQLKVGSPFEFLKGVAAASFDAILVDLEKPNKDNLDFYTNDAMLVAKAALRPGGVLAFKSTEGFCSAGKASCRIVPRLYHTLKNVFTDVSLAVLPMSLYQGNEAVFVAYKDPQPSPEHMALQSPHEVDRRLQERLVQGSKLRYYSGNTQHRAFTLPGVYSEWLTAGDVHKKFPLLTRPRVNKLYGKVPSHSPIHSSCGCKGCTKAGNQHSNTKSDEL